MILNLHRISPDIDATSAAPILPAYVTLLRNVPEERVKDLYAHLTDAKSTINAAVISASMVMRLFDLRASIYRSARAHGLLSPSTDISSEKNSDAKTRSVYTEILYNLSPTNNIGDAFKNFGVSVMKTLQPGNGRKRRPDQDLEEDEQMGRDLIVVYFERDLGGNEWLHEYKEYMDEEVDKYFASFERVVDGQKLRKVFKVPNGIDDAENTGRFISTALALKHS